MATNWQQPKYSSHCDICRKCNTAQHKKEAFALCNSMKRSQMHCTVGNKPDTEDYRMCSPIYIKF